MAEWISDCGTVRLILGDCLEVLPTLEPGAVDAVVTDPPYGINRETGMGGKGKRLAGEPRQYEVSGWDANRPGKTEFEIIISKAPQHIIWGGNYFADLLPQNGKWLFWDKCQTMPSYSDGELAWTSLPGAAVKQFTYNGNGMMAVEKQRFHPTQKPVKLMEWCLGFVDGQTILDPYMGSGSTGVACVRLGRKFIGIEREPDYFEVAKRRILNELERFPLLEQPKTQNQLGLFGEAGQ